MTLHQELTDIILKVAMAHHDDISMADEDNACEAAGAVIAKIISVLPLRDDFRPEITVWLRSKEYSEGWNRYHDTLKDLLTEEKTQ